MKTEPIYSVVISALPEITRKAFMQWEQGAEVKEMYPHATFYRYRRQIKDLIGIDISTPRNPSEPFTIHVTIDWGGC